MWHNAAEGRAQNSGTKVGGTVSQTVRSFADLTTLKLIQKRKKSWPWRCRNSEKAPLVESLLIMYVHFTTSNYWRYLIDHLSWSWLSPRCDFIASISFSFTLTAQRHSLNPRGATNSYITMSVLEPLTQATVPRSEHLLPWSIPYLARIRPPAHAWK